MAKEIKHHVVPSAYLRHFQIDDQANKNFVWCIDCSSKYNLRPQRVGVKHRIFTSPNYYADPRYANPQVFEQLLGRDFEPKYPEIMSDVNAAKITESTVAKLMHWLFISKMRSPMTRSSSEQLLGWMINTANKMKRLEITPEEQSRIDLRVALESKRAQLALLSDADHALDLAKLHIETLNAKHWSILVSDPLLPFITSDNPGFSPNLNAMFAEHWPYHHVMELNAGSMIYFVLSPRYCLHIMPFEQGTPLDVCALRMNVEYIKAPLQLIDFINRGVFYTKHRLIISNSRQVLDLCIKPGPKAQNG